MPFAELTPGKRSLAPIDDICRLGPDEPRLMDTAVQKFCLSERARHRVLKVARAIADLAADEEINTAHLSEAVGFRVPDRHSEDG